MPLLDVTVNLTGVGATGSPGTPAMTGSAVVTVTGQSATGHAGRLRPLLRPLFPNEPFIFAPPPEK